MEKYDCSDREIQRGASKVEESVATEWTNEKHESYLNSLEASFIKQLHNNEIFDWLWRTPVHAASHGLVPKSQSIGQVRHRACWENSEFEKDDNLNKNGSDHERNRGNAVNFKKAKQFCFHRLHKDYIGSVTEVSDQNFEDDNVAHERLSKRRGMKRARSTVSSITDQVVPIMSPMPTKKMEEETLSLNESHSLHKGSKHSPCNS